MAPFHFDVSPSQEFSRARLVPFCNNFVPLLSRIVIAVNPADHGVLA